MSPSSLNVSAMMSTAPTSLCPPTISLHKPAQTRAVASQRSSSLAVPGATSQLQSKPINFCSIIHTTTKAKAPVATLLGAGFFALALVGPASAAEVPSLLGSSSLQLLNEPSNALSLPTWAIHVSSVVEWITAMALVWQYGEKSGNESWKGLSWGMVPLLGGAFCACTWHFFYNSEALEILVALQAALTVIGNATMCFAAYRIYKSSEGSSEKL